MNLNRDDYVEMSNVPRYEVQLIYTFFALPRILSQSRQHAGHDEQERAARVRTAQEARVQQKQQQVYA